MPKVQHAVILAGGTGSRMLPASLYAPKEVLPLVDTPIINHLILESANAGVKKIHLVLSKSKLKYLNKHLSGEVIYEEGVRPDLPSGSLSMKIDGVEIIPHVQTSAKGVGDAISVAIDEIDGPFLLLLGDNVIIDKHVGPRNMGLPNASSASKRLVETYEKTGLPIAGVFPVEAESVHKYGAVDFEGDFIKDIVEKPSLDSAPSNYILCGRYLLTDETARILKKYPNSEYGEMQSIFLLREFIAHDGLMSVKLDDMRMYDSGDPLNWLKSQIDHALLRGDIGGELKKWIMRRVGLN